MTDEGEGLWTGAEIIFALRGGYPDACDFCCQPYTDSRFPEPEEGGAWACTECLARWNREDHEPRHD